MGDFHGPSESEGLYESHNQHDIELRESETRAVAEKLRTFKEVFGEKIKKK